MKVWERGTLISIRAIRKGPWRRFLGAKLCHMDKISRSLHMFGAGERWSEEHSLKKNSGLTLGSGKAFE